MKMKMQGRDFNVFLGGAIAAAIGCLPVFIFSLVRVFDVMGVGGPVGWTVTGFLVPLVEIAAAIVLMVAWLWTAVISPICWARGSRATRLVGRLSIALACAVYAGVVMWLAGTSGDAMWLTICSALLFATCAMAVWAVVEFARSRRASSTQGVADDGDSHDGD